MNDRLDKIVKQLYYQKKRKQLGFQTPEASGIMFGIICDKELSIQDQDAITNIANGLCELEIINTNNIIYLNPKFITNSSFEDGCLLVITNIDELLFSNNLKDVTSMIEFSYNNYGKNALMLFGSQKAFNKLKEIDSSCYAKMKM